MKLAPVLIACCALQAWAAAAPAVDRPNIVWISCEDISPNLGCYGDPDARTPVLDALASRGVRYTQAFTTTGVCATNRSSIITGMYPTTIGTQYMRCEGSLPSQVRCFTEHLRDAGYYCSNDEKEDYNFPTPGAAWDHSGPGAHWRDREAGQPFFAVFNFKLSHESRVWPRGEAHLALSKDLKPDDLQDPARVHLPPYYPDTPETRRDWANYLENITQIDYDAGRVLRQLEEDGLAEETIVIFWSDHGAGLPRGKRWIYDSGTHVPLIVVIPEKLRTQGQGRPGTVSDELVSFIDLAPTVLHLAGVEPPEPMQGRAFLGERLTEPREYVANVRDRIDERYDMIRGIRDKRYRYLRNYMPWKPYAQHVSFAETNQTIKALRRADAQGDLPDASKLFMADAKPLEELYDTLNDPHELNNLARSDDPTHRDVLRVMRGRLAEWEKQSGDLGLIPEPVLRQYEREFGDCLKILEDKQVRESLARVRRMLAPDLPASERSRWLDEALATDDPVERYWAINSALFFDAESTDGVTIVTPEFCGKLRDAIDDESPVVRVSAAAALCRLGETEPAVPVLLEGLNDPSRWVRLHAANFLDELAIDDPRIVRALESIHEDVSDSYVEWVAEHALHEIDGRPIPKRWGVY